MCCCTSDDPYALLLARLFFGKRGEPETHGREGACIDTDGRNQVRSAEKTRESGYNDEYVKYEYIAKIAKTSRNGYPPVA